MVRKTGLLPLLFKLSVYLLVQNAYGESREINPAQAQVAWNWKKKIINKVQVADVNIITIPGIEGVQGCENIKICAAYADEFFTTHKNKLVYCYPTNGKCDQAAECIFHYRDFYPNVADDNQSASNAGWEKGSPELLTFPNCKKLKICIGNKVENGKTSFVSRIAHGNSCSDDQSDDTIAWLSVVPQSELNTTRVASRAPRQRSAETDRPVFQSKTHSNTAVQKPTKPKRKS
jgi:hypothetical protein